MYQIKTENNITWIEASSFSEKGMVTHAFSTRRGGVSAFPYDSLNMGLHTNDEHGCVLENRDRFVRYFGISPQEVTSLHFIHSNIVVPVLSCDGGKGFHSAKDALADADGMITNIPRCTLFITFADCIPILFLDPVRRAIGACHAGWRGTAEGIAQKTIIAMQEAYGTEAKDLLVAVGPGIDPAHFEVGQEVADAVIAHSQAPETLLQKRKNGKYLFDIWQANIDQVCSLGVARQSVTLIDLSTYVRDDLFFSHRRRLGNDTGRMGAFIMLNEVETDDVI